MIQVGNGPSMYYPTITQLEARLNAGQNGGVIRNVNGGVDFANSADLYPAGDGQKNIVEIEYTGSRRQDYGAANRAAGLGDTQQPPDGYAWHHLDNYNPATNKGTMQLVRQDAHLATYPHNGGVRQYEQATGKTYR
jgi:hypothetical protein